MLFNEQARIHKSEQELQQFRQMDYPLVKLLLVWGKIAEQVFEKRKEIVQKDQQIVTFLAQFVALTQKFDKFELSYFPPLFNFLLDHSSDHTYRRQILQCLMVVNYELLYEF